MAFAASGSYQAWYVVHDPINTTIYNSISFWVNGGTTGGQTVGLQAQAGFQLGAAAPGHRPQQ